MKPLISILIPAFNAQRWLSDTIESALNQTWERKEIIVVDDGSSDRTLAVAQRFASKGVVVLTQKNQGAAAARNKAFSVCRGDYIQWLDADDLLDPDKITMQMEALGCRSTPRILLSSAWGRFIHRPSKAKFGPTALWCDLAPLEWLLRKMEQGIFMQTGTWLISRELTEAAGPWDTRLLGDDDGEYFCRVIAASTAVRFVPEARVFYRLSGPASLSYIHGSNKKLEANFLSMQLQIGYVRSLEDSKRVRAACLKYLQTDLPYYYPDRLDLVERSRELAALLGGQLETPKSPAKYAWMQKLFGWRTAKRAQTYYNKLKWSVLGSLDNAMFRLRL
jgi:glycosyltransferase involved in cell wall biosynthesis